MAEDEDEDDDDAVNENKNKNTATTTRTMVVPPPLRSACDAFLFFDCFFCCNDFGLEKIFSFKIRQRGADEARREERSLRCGYVKMKVYILVCSLSLSAIKAALPRWISLFFLSLSFLLVCFASWYFVLR